MKNIIVQIMEFGGKISIHSFLTWSQLTSRPFDQNSEKGRRLTVQDIWEVLVATSGKMLES